MNTSNVRERKCEELSNPGGLDGLHQCGVEVGDSCRSQTWQEGRELIAQQPNQSSTRPNARFVWKNLNVAKRTLQRFHVVMRFILHVLELGSSNPRVTVGVRYVDVLQRGQVAYWR